MKIRIGRKEDLPRVLELIVELAAYEKAADEVEATVAQMEIDGFGTDPIFGFYVAETNGFIIGTAIYYYRYSTWKGKRLYLEDLVVTKAERGKGVGKMLLDRVIQHGLENGCTGIMWQVLEWNKPAINFYQKHYKAKLDGEWFNCSLSKDMMLKAIT